MVSNITSCDCSKLHSSSRIWIRELCDKSLTPGFLRPLPPLKMITKLLLALSFAIVIDVLYGFPIEKRDPLRGIDVSNYQPVINWGDVKTHGNTFAFIMATQSSGANGISFTTTLWFRMRCDRIPLLLQHSTILTSMTSTRELRRQAWSVVHTILRSLINHLDPTKQTTFSPMAVSCYLIFFSWI
jgi:hypothetical protein